MKRLRLGSIVVVALISLLTGMIGICRGLGGDVNGDGKIDLIDALLTLQYSVGLYHPPDEAAFLRAGDVAPLGPAQAPAGDGRVNILDALSIMRHAVNLDPWSLTVPTVTGQTQAEAQAALVAAGLTVGTISQDHSPTIASGGVVSQSPTPGSVVAYGSTVALTISTGPATVAVPSVVGQTQDAAQSALTGAGLTTGTITPQSSAGIPSGTVISQNPTTGTVVAIGSAVVLVVSSGPPPLTVPDVVGLTQQAARDSLTAKGYLLGAITQTNSSSVVEGNVISQTPTAGNAASSGSSVSLVLSKGKAIASIAVPKVVGKSQAEAATAVTAAGLTVGAVGQDFSSTTAAGVIITQSPLSGALALPEAPVSLIISKGPLVTPPTPPDPATKAPSLDTQATLAAATSFLYTGADAIQTGVPEGTIEVKRAAILRGKVLDRDNQPLSGVNITIKDHPEFGQTFTRADGMFDLAVNGGGYLTISYRKSGLFPLHRQVNAPWQDYAWLPDVIMLPVDTQATAVDLSSPEPVQVAQGGVVTDKDGARQATLLFTQGTTAAMTLPDGSSQPLTSLTIRATEYTVGDNGPKAMPAPLPANSGYTYAVELSADEALAAGATTVTFSKAVPFYLDDFIGFPVGSAVPTGYYDRQKGAWIPSPNGVVLRILGISAGMAEIDVTGSGDASDAAILAGFGIDDAERAKLATLYPTTPKQLWRVPVTHFSPYDLNWPFYSDNDNNPDPKQPPPDQDKNDQCSAQKQGSTIQCQNQTLGETVKIPGTEYNLTYQSNRTEGYGGGRAITFRITGASVPASLESVELTISIAGRTFRQTFPAQPNQSYPFTWDGKDGYGRKTPGKQPYSAVLSYVYGRVYYVPVSWDTPGNTAFARYITPEELQKLLASGLLKAVRSQSRTEQRFQGYLGKSGFQQQYLGLWTLNVHHDYDLATKTLYLGTGSQVAAQITYGSGIVTTVAGISQIGTNRYSGDGGLATDALLSQFFSVAVGPDGSLYFLEDIPNDLPRVRKINPEGIITTIARPSYFFGNSNVYGHSVVVAPDGSLYISGPGHIGRVDSSGIITTVAGGSGVGAPPTEDQLISPMGIAVGPDGSLYFTDSDSTPSIMYESTAPPFNRIRRVGPDGIITTVAGTGNPGYSGDGGPATGAMLNHPWAIVVAPDRSLYFTDMGNHCVRRIGPDGIITTVAGTGTAGYSGDGGQATGAKLRYPSGVAVASDGSLYIVDYGNSLIRRVDSAGVITSVAGWGSEHEDGVLAASAWLWAPISLTVGHDGSLYVAIFGDHTIRRIAPIDPTITTGDFLVASPTGDELYEFTLSGRHLRTLNALTGAVTHSFGYDQNGLLISLTDGAGNVTTIERDAAGKPTAIIAPFGQRTALTLDANGYLTAITNPAGESHRMTYTSDGLLKSFADPKGNVSTMTYDEMGRLTRDENQMGGFWRLVSTRSWNSTLASITSALNRTTTYLSELLSTGNTRKTTTLPTGAKVVEEIGANGTTRATLADGTVTTSTLGPDPRFGMQSPIETSATVKTPSGLTYSRTMARTASLTIPKNPLTLTAFTDTVTVNGRQATTTYDASLRQFTLTSPKGRVSRYVTDQQGRAVSLLADARLPLVTYDYDTAGLLTATAKGDSRTAFAYDTAGRLSSVTDPLSRTTRYDYDTADRVRQLTLPSGRIYQFTYDANGNRTGITMPSGVKHTLGYTVVNLDKEYTPPGNPAYVWEYSLDKEWRRTTLPSGRTVDAAYDDGGLATGLLYPEATISLLYGDSTSRVKKIVRAPSDGGASQELALTYDGSLVTGRAFSGPASGAFGYTYDTNFFLTKLALTSGSDTVTSVIARDSDGLITGYGPFTFDRSGPAGLTTGITDGVMTIAQTFDTQGQVATRTHTVAGTKIYEAAFTYDAAGQISRRSETIDGSTVTLDFTYDADGQLRKVTNGDFLVEEYSFDTNGNRTGYKNGSGLNLSATFDGQDRLLTQGETAYRFDADGFMTTRDADTFTYSAQGELLSATVDGATVTYAYDGLHRRMARTDSSGTYQYLYGNPDNQFELTAARDTAGVMTRYYYDADRQLIAFDRSGKRYYVATDQTGSPRVITDGTGAVVRKIEYRSFGDAPFDSNPAFDLPIGFAGGLSDAATLLVRFGYRDYEPMVGRWTAKDLILFAGGSANLYGYVGNNPINLTDPTGLSPSLGDCLMKCSGDQLGLTTLFGAAGVGLGAPIIPTMAKPIGSTPGTSIASSFLAKLFPQRIGSTWAPR